MIDIRSDTVTKPSKEMLEHIITAEVGDDEYKDCLLYTSDAADD